jgi:hypothetical protein
VDVASAEVCNLLEEKLQTVAVARPSASNAAYVIELEVRPFQILTVKLNLQ